MSAAAIALRPAVDHSLGPLAPLAERQRFVLVRLEPLGNGKTKKLPIRCDTLQGCDAHEPAFWVAHETAANMAGALGASYCVGYVLRDDDQFFCLDIDGCAEPGGGWSPLVHTLASYLPGVVTEISQSGKGLHIWGRRSVMPAHSQKNIDLHIELYSRSGRFIALGHSRVGEMAADCTHIDAVAAYYFPPTCATLGAMPAEWTDEPVEGWRAPIEDDKLQAMLDGTHAERATAAEVFGAAKRLTLHQLWTADPDELQAEGVRSEARMSLLSKLVHLTGGNCQRVADLTADHPLAVKDEREGLHRSEILSAYKLFLKWWAPEKARRDAQQAEARLIGEALGDLVTPTLMTLDQMVADLVYVNQGKVVVHRGTRKALKWDEAAGAYAASRHQYVEAAKERDLAALPIWRAHGQRHTVDALAWNPAGGEFCTPSNGTGGATTAFNTFRGLKPLQAPATWRELIGPFLQHVAYLVPVEAERMRFLQWLAHIVQRPGELPHTCYLMIAHETGIGRNWLAGVLARVLRGFVAAGVALADVLDGKFNGRLSEKLLATVDETREGMTANRYARGEALKRLITEEYRNINNKYGLQVVEVNCCRWLMFSNHDDALPFDNNDRRIVVIENPNLRQTPDYYTALYALIHRPEFIASVGEYLRTLPLEGFNPGAHAPMNAAKQRALDVMAPSADRAIKEFAEAWPTPYTTVTDVRHAVYEFTGETPKEPGFSHAVRRAGMVPAGAGKRLYIDGQRERSLAVNVAPEVLAQVSLDQIAASIKQGRKLFNVQVIPAVPAVPAT